MSDSYYLFGTVPRQQTEPLVKSDLLQMYGLEALAKLVARTNPDGSKAVKLRKLYKGHIALLPGKHPVPKERTLLPVVFVPTKEEQGLPPATIKLFKDSKEGQLALLQAVQFQRSGDGGIPGFDPAELAIDDAQDDLDGRRKRAHSNTPPGGVKRQHI